MTDYTQQDASSGRKKKIWLGVGALVIVAAAATAIAVTTTKSSSTNDASALSDHSATTAAPHAPTPTVTHVMVNNVTTTPALKVKTPHNIRLPPSPPATDLPTKPTCPQGRTAQPGDTVFLTIDDGPSVKGRMNLLTAAAQVNTSLSFFESAYNFCGPETSFEQTLECVTPSPYAQVADLIAMTIKQGHMLAAHSNTHYYDKGTGLCDYIKKSKEVKIDPQFATCGNSPAADMVRGALRIETAMNNESLWDNDQEFGLYQQAMASLWTYARLPCTSAWRLPNYQLTTGLAGSPETDARNKVADDMFKGDLPCRNETFKYKPWQNVGWDVEWNAAKVTDTEGSKCEMLRKIENAFGHVDGRRRQQVVLLTHDYQYDTPAKGKMFRDLIVELKLRGYALNTVNNLKIY